jgi:hypothetical protein
VELPVFFSLVFGVKTPKTNEPLIGSSALWNSIFFCYWLFGVLTPNNQ